MAQLRDLGLTDRMRRRRRVLSAEELEAMYGACEDLRHRALFEFLRATGCRASEALGVTRADLDLSATTPKVSFPETKGKVRRGSSGELHVEVEPRETGLTIFDERAPDVLKTYIQERGIRPERKLFPLSSRSVRYIIGALAIRAALQNADDVHPHTLRHTAATRALDMGFSPVEVKHMFGWSQNSRTFETTYAHPTTEGLLRKARRLRTAMARDDTPAAPGARPPSA